MVATTIATTATTVVTVVASITAIEVTTVVASCSRVRVDWSTSYPIRRLNLQPFNREYRSVDRLVNVIREFVKLVLVSMQIKPEVSEVMQMHRSRNDVVQFSPENRLVTFTSVTRIVHQDFSGIVG